MKARWVNLILKITSIIQNSKGKLLTSHAFKSIFLVLLIIFCELLLSIVSFPLYLVESSPSDKKIETKEYKTRRAITLSVVGVIAVIWLIKLALIGMGMMMYRNSSEIIIDEASAPPVSEVTQEHIFGVQRATLNAALSKPTLNRIQYTNQRIEFSGTATPDQQIFLYLYRLTEDKIDAKNQTLSVVTTQTNQQGQFNVIPDNTQFRFSPGKYQVEVVGLDPATKTFSEPSTGSVFTVNDSLFSNTQRIHLIDTLLNIAIFIFILIGLVMTLLIT